MYKRIETVDPQHLLGDIAFCVFNADSFPQQQRPALDSFEEVRTGNIGLWFVVVGKRGVELRGIRQYGLNFLVHLIGDIHYKVWFEVTVLDVMEYVFRAPGFLSFAIIAGFDFPEAGEKSSVFYQFGAAAMIGVTIFQCITKNDFGTVFTDGGDHLADIGFINLEKPSAICRFSRA